MSPTTVLIFAAVAAATFAIGGMLGRRSHIDREIRLNDALLLLDTASGSTGPIRVGRDGHITVG